MPKILILDTYYPDFLRSLPPIGEGTLYPVELRRVLDYGFGTADFYSHNLRRLGWEAVDVIANYADLQRVWLRDHGKWAEFGNMQAIALEQIRVEDPDVIFMQDLSFFDPATLGMLANRHLLVGQCSCPIPSASRISKFHVLFTSFPHYVTIFKSYGVRAEYLPLAFNSYMTPPNSDRDMDISFVGGVGEQAHWKSGTRLLESVADSFGDRFHWYGYGLANLAPESPLRECYRGTAWGKEMYAVYGRSKIVINRHGEVAAGYSNNLRMYEATGCGALLMTEESANLSEHFPTGSVMSYRDQGDLLSKIEFYLANGDAARSIAVRGQSVTLTRHSYSDRMSRVSESLHAVLQSRSAVR